jgi:hypothetical protein
MKLITNNQGLWKIITTLESYCTESTINDVACVLELFTDTLYLTSFGDIYDVTTNTIYNFKTPEDLFLSEIDIAKIPTANSIYTIYGDNLATLTWGTYIAALVSKLPTHTFSLSRIGATNVTDKEIVYETAVSSNVYSTGKEIDKEYEGVIGAHNKFFSFDFSKARLTGKVLDVNFAILPPEPIPVPEELFFVEDDELFYIPMIKENYFVGSSGKFYNGTNELSFFTGTDSVITVEIENVSAIMVDTWFLVAMSSGRLKRGPQSEFSKVKPYTTDSLISPTNLSPAISVVKTEPTLVVEPEFIIGAS